MQKVWFVLGADDPEMRLIVTLLRARMAGRIVYATRDGIRVHAGNAYDADSVAAIQPDDKVVLIECGLRDMPPGVTVMRVDHHRKTDRAYHRPPAEYWLGSSIGQVAKMLRLPAYRHWRIIAAMDHCFVAAMRGECPGAPPREVLVAKLDEIAKAHRVSIASVKKRVRQHEHALVKCDMQQIAGRDVRDYRDVDLGVGYSVDLLCAQVAAVSIETPALFRHSDPGGRPKVTLYAAAPETVCAFEQWATDQSWVDYYGVPNRGYAGAYLK